MGAKRPLTAVYLYTYNRGIERTMERVMSQQDACGQSESVLRAQALDAMREALVVPLMRAFWRHRYDRKLTNRQLAQMMLSAASDADLVAAIQNFNRASGLAPRVGATSDLSCLREWSRSASAQDVEAVLSNTGIKIPFRGQP